MLFAGLHLIFHLISAVRKASSENEAERQEGQGCLLILGGLFGYGMVAALIRAALEPMFGDTDGVAAASFILPLAVLVLGFVGMRMRSANGGEPVAAQVPPPAAPGRPPAPALPALPALGIADVLRHLDGAVPLPCEGVQRRGGGPLWDATITGGPRVVFEPVAEPPVQRGRIQLVAFVVDARAWPDEAAYAATEDAALLDTIFADADLRDDDVDDRPLAFLAGRVVDASEDVPMVRCRVALPGAALSVVGAESRVKGGPVKGGVLEGTFWLCGRVSPSP